MLILETCDLLTWIPKKQTPLHLHTYPVLILIQVFFRRTYHIKIKTKTMGKKWAKRLN